MNGPTGFFGNANNKVNPTTSGGLFSQTSAPSLNLSSQQQQQQQQQLQQQSAPSLFNPTSTQTLGGTTLGFNSNASNTLQQNQPLLQQQAPLYPTLQPQPIQTSQSNISRQEIKTVPTWCTDNIKRTTPQTIVRRSNKETNDEQDPFSGSSAPSTAKDAFGTVSFGMKKSNTFNSIKSVSSTFNSAKLNDSDQLGSPNKNNLSFHLDSTDAPPAKSIFDIQREDEFSNRAMDNGVVESTGSSNATEERSKSPAKKMGIFKSKNIFDKSKRQEPLHEIGDNVNSFKKESHSPSADAQGYAVLVFGYPESISNQVIAHFSKFGKVMEDFEVCREEPAFGLSRFKNSGESGVDKTKYPIFTGNGWVKITYNTETSALRALKENGTLYGGVLLGCVPYSKDSVEGLTNCKIEKYQDSFSVSAPALPNDKSFPSSNSNASTTAQTQPVFTKGQKESVDAKNEPLFANARKLNVTSGANIFAHNNSGSLYNNTSNGQSLKNGGWYNTLESVMTQDVASSKHPNGIVGKLSNWLFGWSEL